MMIQSRGLRTLMTSPSRFAIGPDFISAHRSRKALFLGSSADFGELPNSVWRRISPLAPRPPREPVPAGPLRYGGRQGDIHRRFMMEFPIIGRSTFFRGPAIVIVVGP